APPRVCARWPQRSGCAPTDDGWFEQKKRFSGNRQAHSVQGLPISFQADRQGDRKEQKQRPQMLSDVGELVSLEQNSPDDPEKMSEWQGATKRLSPLGHASEGKHES